MWEKNIYNFGNEIVQKGSFGTQAARLQVLVKRTSRPLSTFLDNPVFFCVFFKKCIYLSR